MTISFFYTRMWSGIFCGLIFLLEVFAPLNYVFGYLYFIPMLLTACDLTSCHVATNKIVANTSMVAAIGISLTLMDFIVPIIMQHGTLNFSELPIAIIINRVSVVAILLVANWLIKSSLEHLEKIYQQKNEIDLYKAELANQIQIDRIHQDFVYTLTHDLKTPLLGAIQTIKYFKKAKFGAVSSTQMQVLDTMSRAQSRSLQLVETLLAIYQNDTQGLALYRQQIELCSLAQETIDSMLVLGWERQITIKLHCHLPLTDPPRLTGDRLQLSRVFNNLLSNALYHSPRHRQIDVTIEVRDSQHIVCVFDRGLGIDPADFPFLFERFYTAHKQFQGSGLGLYLSRQIVEAHGGKIWAESQSPRSNTTFCFSLPLEN
jgi:two-component system, NarL family, sensor kinase